MSLLCALRYLCCVFVLSQTFAVTSERSLYPIYLCFPILPKRHLTSVLMSQSQFYCRFVLLLSSTNVSLLLHPYRSTRCQLTCSIQALLWAAKSDRDSWETRTFAAEHGYHSACLVEPKFDFRGLLKAI